MASEDEFDLADLCFANNVEINMFDELLNFNSQPQIIEEATKLPETKTKPDKFTDSEEKLYFLTKRLSFVDWKDVERYNKSRTKSRKYQKHIAAFNDEVPKKVLKENTNL
ncbi:20331_t:CDS:2 [Dentiscutata erythropus]|uniref:20331_t:CDS:1 n=1 Tax=Dentiscutata erythropus TaxID=1348616 RepID=A0A9N9C631_9GLOM|nr:20331_t:CDS:2 [Dentiscutata erythropus]